MPFERRVDPLAECRESLEQQANDVKPAADNQCLGELHRTSVGGRQIHHDNLGTSPVRDAFKIILQCAFRFAGQDIVDLMLSEIVQGGHKGVAPPEMMLINAQNPWARRAETLPIFEGKHFLDVAFAAGRPDHQVLRQLLLTNALDVFGKNLFLQRLARPAALPDPGDVLPECPSARCRA